MAVQAKTAAIPGLATVYAIFFVFAVDPETGRFDPGSGKRPRFGAGPPGNRVEFCVGWLAKSPTSETIRVKKLFPKTLRYEVF